MAIKHTVRPGDVVDYYIGGSLADPPMPGQVLEVFGEMITVCIRTGGNWHDRPRVFHKDSDHIKTHPTNALKFGMWAYRMPSILPSPETETTPPVVADQTSSAKPKKTPVDIT